MKWIEQLDSKEIAELLGKCWMTHDGMWFHHCVSELGIERANALNKAAIRSLAPIEIARFRAALGIKKEHLDTFTELKTFIMNITDLVIPEFMNIRFGFPEKNRIYWEFNEKKCFAYNGVRRMGVIDQYECGPIYRLQCWLDCLSVEYSLEPKIDLCIDPDHGMCTGHFRLFFP